MVVSNRVAEAAMAVDGGVENGRRWRRAPIGAAAGLDGGRDDGGNVGDGEGVVVGVTAATMRPGQRQIDGRSVAVHGLILASWRGGGGRGCLGWDGEGKAG